MKDRLSRAIKAATPEEKYQILYGSNLEDVNLLVKALGAARDQKSGK
jgi:hypothetical protein